MGMIFDKLNRETETVVNTFGKIADNIWCHERDGKSIIFTEYFFKNGRYDGCNSDEFLPGERGYNSLNKYLSEAGL